MSSGLALGFLAAAVATSPASVSELAIGDARSLMAETDDERVRSQLDYYMKTSLRGDPANSASLCGA